MLRSNVTGVLDHLRGWEPLGAGDTAQTSLQRSLALLQESDALAPPKMVATARCGSWKPKPAPRWANLIAVIVVVAVIAATVAAAPLALCREVLEEEALGEVVPVGVVELAPFVVVPAGRSGLSFATRRVSPGWWPRAPLRGQDGGSLPLVCLGARFRAVARRRPQATNISTNALRRMHHFIRIWPSRIYVASS